jgi:hypothetical protein
MDYGEGVSYFPGIPLELGIGVEIPGVTGNNLRISATENIVN